MGDLSPPIGSDAFDNDGAFGEPMGITDDRSTDGYSCWQVRYYAKWFNVDTSDVSRLHAAHSLFFVISVQRRVVGERRASAHRLPYLSLHRNARC